VLCVNQVSISVNQRISCLSYRIERKGLDHLCEGCKVAPINQQSGNREGDQDDQKNKNRKEQATLEEMVQSGSQLVLRHDDGSDQPIEEIMESNVASDDYPFDKDFPTRTTGISLEDTGSSQRP